MDRMSSMGLFHAAELPVFASVLLALNSFCPEGRHRLNFRSYRLQRSGPDSGHAAFRSGSAGATIFQPVVHIVLSSGARPKLRPYRDQERRCHQPNDEPSERSSHGIPPVFSADLAPVTPQIHSPKWRR